MAQHRQTAPRSIRARTVIGGVLAAGTMVLGAGSMVLAAPAGIALADEVPPPTPVDPPATETPVDPPPTETPVDPPPTETPVDPPPTPTPTPVPPPVGHGKGIGSGGVPGAIGGPGSEPVPPGSVLRGLAKLPGSQPDAMGIQPGQAVKGLTPAADNGNGPDAP
jgi:hypothetical protein